MDSEAAINNYNEELKNQLLKFKTKFIFNPPAAPWFGGIWERNIGSMKYHLKRVVGDKKLTFEEFSTVLIQIEACLNSRPLCPLPDNPEECDALTPGHFLVGGALTAPIESTLMETQENRLSRWERCTKMQQEFWEKWNGEYASQLQVRTKWTDIKPNVEVDDMVLIKHESTPPLQWPLGRVVKVYVGKDDLVRVADVKTNGNIFKRPVGKLAILPVKNEVTIAKGTGKINSSQTKQRKMMRTTDNIQIDEQ